MSEGSEKRSEAVREMRELLSTDRVKKLAGENLLEKITKSFLTMSPEEEEKLNELTRDRFIYSSMSIQERIGKKEDFYNEYKLAKVGAEEIQPNDPRVKTLEKEISIQTLS